MKWEGSRNRPPTKDETRWRACGVEEGEIDIRVEEGRAKETVRESRDECERRKVEEKKPPIKVT